MVSEQAVMLGSLIIVAPWDGVWLAACTAPVLDSLLQSPSILQEHIELSKVNICIFIYLPWYVSLIHL